MMKHFVNHLIKGAHVSYCVLVAKLINHLDSLDRWEA